MSLSPRMRRSSNWRGSGTACLGKIGIHREFSLARLEEASTRVRATCAGR